MINLEELELNFESEITFCGVGVSNIWYIFESISKLIFLRVLSIDLYFLNLAGISATDNIWEDFLNLKALSKF